MRETFENITEDTRCLISYPIQWSNWFSKPKIVNLDLAVTKIKVCVHNGKREILYRYGKSETVENDLGQKRVWRVTLPKSEGVSKQ
jgi:hypothetical protein